MRCPYCNHKDSKVVDSRGMSGAIRRRRQCLACGARFTTYERIQPASLFVVKKDGRRETFNMAKLLGGIRKACEKRPLPTGTIDKLVEDITDQLYRLGKVEVTSSLIGDMVMERLKNLDHIAYIRFASVYRDFADIAMLKQAVDSLVGAEPRPSMTPSQLPLLSTTDTPGDKGIKGKRRNRDQKRIEQVFPKNSEPDSTLTSKLGTLPSRAPAAG